MPDRMLPTEQYRALVDHSPVMIWRAEPDRRRDWFNRTWLAHTGRTLAEEVGEGWAQGVHPEDLETYLATYDQHFERREPFESEYRLRRHDGVYRWVFDRAVPFHHEDGSFAGYVGSCVDVDERRRLDSKKARFLAMMAHEQRTPLTSLKTLVEVMRRRLERAQAPGPELVEQLRSQVQRLERLVADLSDTARLEEGLELPLARRPVDLAATVRSVLSERGVCSTGAPLSSRGHTLDLDLPAAPARVTGDERRLAQVLRIVVDNAVKYAPEGGPVRVCVTPGEEAHLVTVSDRGIGVPEAEVADLTRRYFRASNASPEHYPGIGLGLALAREIVERHGGTLRIESRLGHGTTVGLVLPAGEADG